MVQPGRIPLWRQVDQGREEIPPPSDGLRECSRQSDWAPVRGQSFMGFLQKKTCAAASKIDKIQLGKECRQHSTHRDVNKTPILCLYSMRGHATAVAIASLLTIIKTSWPCRSFLPPASTMVPVPFLTSCQIPVRWLSQRAYMTSGRQGFDNSSPTQ